MCMQSKVCLDNNITYIKSFSCRSRSDMDLIGLVNARTFSAPPGLFCSKVFPYISVPEKIILFSIHFEKNNSFKMLTNDPFEIAAICKCIYTSSIKRSSPTRHKAINCSTGQRITRLLVGIAKKPIYFNLLKKYK